MSSCIRSTERHADCSVSQTLQFDTGNKHNCINNPGFLSLGSIWPTLGGRPPPLRQLAILRNVLKNPLPGVQKLQNTFHQPRRKKLIFLPFRQPKYWITLHYGNHVSSKKLKKKRPVTTTIRNWSNSGLILLPSSLRPPSFHMVAKKYAVNN